MSKQEFSLLKGKFKLLVILFTVLKVLYSIFCERYWLKRSLITVVLIIRLALPLFCQINPIQITIIISESKKSPNETLKQWWNVPRKPNWMFQFLNVKILSIFNSTYQTLALCSNSSLEYLFPTSSNTVSIVFCSVKSFFDHHDCIFEE